MSTAPRPPAPASGLTSSNTPIGSGGNAQPLGRSIGPSCWICLERGHISRECPQSNRPPPPATKNELNPLLLVRQRGLGIAKDLATCKATPRAHTGRRKTPSTHTGRQSTHGRSRRHRRRNFTVKNGSVLRECQNRDKPQHCPTAVRPIARESSGSGGKGGSVYSNLSWYPTYPTW